MAVMCPPLWSRPGACAWMPGMLQGAMAAYGFSNFNDYLTDQKRIWNTGAPIDTYCDSWQQSQIACLNALNSGQQQPANLYQDPNVLNAQVASQLYPNGNTSSSTNGVVNTGSTIGTPVTPVNTVNTTAGQNTGSTPVGTTEWISGVPNWVLFAGAGVVAVILVAKRG